MGFFKKTSKKKLLGDQARGLANKIVIERFKQITSEIEIKRITRASDVVSSPENSTV